MSRLSPVDYRPLGGTGLELSSVGLGCGNFGGIGSAPELFGQGEGETEAFAIMDRAEAAGINFFDTAASYGGGRSESWIGNWRRERESSVLLSTKVYWSVTGDPNDRGLSRERILRELDGSLSRLQAKRVDMYLTHEPDPETPIEETIRTLDEVVAAGKVGAIGVSNAATSWRTRSRRATPKGSPASGGSRTNTACSAGRRSARCCRSARARGSASLRSAPCPAAG
jgi:aryl-alcohol dehydrogenase-like predicted oxidoreductase